MAKKNYNKIFRHGEALQFIPTDFSSPETKKRIKKTIKRQKRIDASLRHDNDPRDCKHTFR